jgi:hypothetical protein
LQPTPNAPKSRCPQLFLLGFLLRMMMAGETSDGGTRFAMVSRNMAGDRADGGALEASLGGGRRGEAGGDERERRECRQKMFHRELLQDLARTSDARPLLLAALLAARPD